MANRVATLLARHKKLQSEKAVLNGIYSLISEYVFNKKYNLAGTPNGGLFVDGDIYDNTGLRANSIMSNVMVNNLWPNGPRTFRVRKTWDTPDTKENKDWFKWVNSQMYSVMDNSIIRVDSSGQRHCFATTTEGIAVGVSVVKLDVKERTDYYETTQVQAILEMGAVRTEGVQVQEVLTTKAA